MFTNVKEFCKETGFPIKTLKKYIKEGKIPYHKVGRVYILNRQKTLLKLDEIAENHDIPRIPTYPKIRKPKSYSPQNFNNDIQYLKTLTKK